MNISTEASGAILADLHESAEIELIYPDQHRNYLVIAPRDSNTSLLSLRKDLIVDLYKSHGAILFRNFSTDAGHFKDFSSFFLKSSFINPTLGRDLIDDKSRIQTVDLGTAPFPLHPELSQTFLRPDVCWFYCLKEPEIGGETKICDGSKISESLKKETLKLLKSKSLRYRTTISLDHFRGLIDGRYDSLEAALEDPQVSHVFQLKGSKFLSKALRRKWIRRIGRRLHLKGQRIYQNSVLPCLHKPMFMDTLAFGNFILFSRLLHKTNQYPIFDDESIIPEELVLEVKEISDELSCDIRWHKNDLLMLDNTRFMHGRNRIHNIAERVIYSRFGVVNFQ